MSELRDDWERLRAIVEGRSEFGRTPLAALKADELAARISREHHVSVHVPTKDLDWLRGKDKLSKLDRLREKEKRDAKPSRRSR